MDSFFCSGDMQRLQGRHRCNSAASCRSFYSIQGPEIAAGASARLRLEHHMNREQGAIRLTKIMRDIFDSDDLQYHDALTISNVPGWDSLGHMRFLSAVEKNFSIQFTSGEIDSFENAGNVLDAILMREIRG
jgi:acyl carrier protein